MGQETTLIRVRKHDKELLEGIAEKYGYGSMAETIRWLLSGEMHRPKPYDIVEMENRKLKMRLMELTDKKESG